MNSSLRIVPEVTSYYTALWISALMLAANPALEVAPVELDELAHAFFSRFKPVAKT
jgi:hypothetical protein